METLEITIEAENREMSERKDPTSFLPDEPMSYEIKKKKKKKKKKKNDDEDDPFKDVRETVFVTERVGESNMEMASILDPEVTIKVENIDCDLDFNDFVHDGELLMQTEGNDGEEQEIKIENKSHKATILTFEKVDRQTVTKEIDENGEVRESETTNSLCTVCHLIFKNQKTLQLHQKRKHKLFRNLLPHSCDYCHMSYEFKSSLKMHIKRKHNPNLVDDNTEQACDICALVFKGTSRLRIHMRRKHDALKDSFKHVCKDCGITYEKYSSLCVHRRRKHPTKQPSVEELWLSCPFCPKVFNKRETYARHMQRKHHAKDGSILPNPENIYTASHNDAGEIVCKECPLVFSSMSYLKTHMRRKHNALQETYRLKCKICNLSYDKIESLKRHVKRKHDDGSYCNTCNKQFSTRESYLNHSHSKMVKECKLCGSIFASENGLSKHLRCKHKITTPIVVHCHICNKGFHEKRLLKPHLLRVHYNVSYPCDICKKVFKARESYRRHVLFKHQSGDVSEMHKCEQCPETFEDEFELCKHVNLTHRGLKIESAPKIKEEIDDEDEFHCLKCPDKYSSFDQLRFHYEEQHVLNKTRQCQICGDFVLEKDLQKHMKRNHLVPEEQKCRFCDFKTTDKVSMTQHILRHKNATTLTCDYPKCRYKTYYEAAMAKHKAKHSEQGIKLQCSKCPFQSMNKYILRYHEEAHSTGKKKYNCDQCDYATILPANLVQHKYKHSTEKRFKCEVCPFATKYNTSLRFHVKKKHCDLPMS